MKGPIKIKKRYTLNKKETKRVEIDFADSFGVTGSGRYEKAETDIGPLILRDGHVVLFTIDDKPFPSLRHLQNVTLDSGYVVVDMGAIKFVTNGADVMAPGIVDADDTIQIGDIVVIAEVSHRKPLAVGIALTTGAEMKAGTTGKAITTVHHIGDALWDLDL